MSSLFMSLILFLFLLFIASRNGFTDQRLTLKVSKQTILYNSYTIAASSTDDDDGDDDDGDGDDDDDDDNDEDR